MKFCRLQASSGTIQSTRAAQIET
ncbi:Uncharacterized protein APZ42_023898 [Daphnia magna]|uniref:Uncharacterized protein n=1 Tax=Daphnia magna TaxID=35525 RepID=A0A164U8E8_9CRUS|nr:Uncharacterized protein APZ42_023898 [Daphnia magna]